MLALLVMMLVAVLTLFSTAAGAKTLIFCPDEGPKGFNPQLYTDNTTFDASSRALYDRLVGYDPGTTRIAPALAESWIITGNGKIYTFKLRHGVKFHHTDAFTPSRDFNADDVLFSLLRQWQPEHPYHAVSGGRYEYFNGMGLQRLIQAIDKIDDDTVRIVIEHPEASLLATLAMDFASILSAEYAAKLQAAGEMARIDREPVGTGPFALREYHPNRRIVYRAHAEYWGAKTPIDELVFAITPNSKERLAKLKSGECHVLPPLATAAAGILNKANDFKILQKPGLDVGYLAFNTRKAPFDNLKVRQALSMAINKTAIVAEVFQGAAVAAKNPLPPTVWSYHDGMADYPYDVEQAKALLAEAGYPAGFETDLWAPPVARPYDPQPRILAELIQSQWQQVGVKTRIVAYEWEEFLYRSRNGEHSTILLGWVGDNGDPDNFLSVLLGCDKVGGSNRAEWCYPPFEELLKQGRNALFPEQRLKIYREAQEIFHQQAPWVPLAHSLWAQPLHKSVEGFVMDAFGGNRFHGVDLKIGEQ